jgi:hypothetical protein
MNKIISERLSSIALLTLLSLFLLFHFLIMFGIIPFEIVWGGRLNSRSQMLRSETVSVIINLLMLAIVAIKANILEITLPKILIKIILWLMFVLFILNTLGNLFSLNQFEQLVFTPVTFLLALFSLRLAISRS